MRRTRIEIPNLKPLDKLRRGYEAKFADRQLVVNRLRDLEAERPRAVERDKETFAKAIAKGGIDAKDPGTPEVDKLDVKIASERRRLEAAEAEVATAEGNVVAEVEHNRMTYLRQIDEQITAADKVYGERVEQLLTARTEQDELRRLRLTITRFPDPVKTSTVARPLATVKKVNGQPLTGGELAAALREDASPGEPVRVPVPAESLEGVDRFVAA
jgi:hypothetical protein